MSSSNSLPRSAAGDRNPWIIAVVVSIATFMEVLDSTIANVSLNHIAGSLAIGPDESTWILTSYLISNAIILPISGWLANLIGRKRFYMICVGLFTFSSLFCALAPNLTIMIVFRVMQGLGGGGLAPTEQSIFADTFRPAQRELAFAVYGVTVIIAPAVGPVLGGWLTEDFSWHWIFLINLPVGILSLSLIFFLVTEPDALKEDTKKFRANFIPDWLGFVLVALTFGCLQVVLDRFQQDDGFSSQTIVIFATIAAVSGIALVWWELHHPQPIFDVRLFKKRSFAITCVLMFALGFTLYSTTQLIPEFAQTVLNYDAFRAGQVLTFGGLAGLCLMPVAGVIGKKVQPKVVLLGAFCLSSIAFFYTSRLDSTVGFGDLALARVFQSMALPFLFVTLTTSGYVGMPPNKTGEASALVNLMRNLGAGVGISVSQTELAWRSQYHQGRLAEHVSAFHGIAKSLSNLRLDGIARVMQAQALTLSYLDIYWLFGIGALLVAPLALFLKGPAKGASANAH